MQWIVRVRAGDTSEPQLLAPDDVSYRIGAEECHPCRRIRVMVTRRGTLRLTLTSTEPRTTMKVWVNGHRFEGGPSPLTGEIPVNVGEHLVHVSLTVGAPRGNGYVGFTLATEWSRNGVLPPTARETYSPKEKARCAWAQRACPWHHTFAYASAITW